MNRTEFIKTIMELYPRTFNKENPIHYQSWIDRYKNAIPESWDFNRLMWHFETKWTSVTEPPPPSFFYKFKEDVKAEIKKEMPKLTPKQIEESRKSYEKFKEDLKMLVNSKTID